MVFRIYEPHECGPDGYPHVWHRGLQGMFFPPSIPTGVKHIVRLFEGNRCERCRHPYLLGSGVWGDDPTRGQPTARLLSLLEEDLENPSEEMRVRPPLWSACDGECTHLGPCRIFHLEHQEAGATWNVPPRGFVRTGCKNAGDVLRGLISRGFVPGTTEVQASWRILTVHHLNGHKHDLRWWNLAALCQRCHLEIQNKVTMERIYPLEHTEWFKPHAAGWYAYAYEGADLSRVEVMADLDRLLALERMA